jgi:transposase
VHPDGRARWRRTDPWETGFVDLTGAQALVGQVDGRTSAAVQAWLGARSPAFREAVEVVVIDPHAGYAAAVRAALPAARVAVDHFHLIMLANKAVAAVRQRVTRDLLGRCGRTIDLSGPAFFGPGFHWSLCCFLAFQPGVVNFLRCAVSES